MVTMQAEDVDIGQRGMYRCRKAVVRCRVFRKWYRHDEHRGPFIRKLERDQGEGVRPDEKV